MSQNFDPYHVWLGIPPAEQPPSYYRLLGLRPFEPNPNVIDNAYQRSITHLRTLLNGPQAALARKLLDEVSSAAECLLDPIQKAQYDQTLAQRINERRAAPVPVTAVPVAAAPVQVAPPPATVAVTQRPSAAPRAHQRAASPSPVLQMVKLIGGGILGLALGYLAVYYALGRDFLGLLPPLSPPRKPPSVAVNPIEPEPKPAPPQAKHNHVPPESPPPPIAPPERPPNFPPAPPTEPPAVPPRPVSPEPPPIPAPAELALPAEPPIVSEPNNKLPQPTTEQRQKMLAELQAMYKAEFDRANRPEGRAPLVAFLLETARKLKSDTTAQYVLYREAFDRALRLEDFTTVAEVIDELERTFDVDGYRLRLHLLIEASKAAQSPAERQPLVSFALELAEHAEATDRVEDFAKLSNVIESHTRALGREFRAKVAGRHGELRKSAEVFAPVVAARERLASDPANRAAALVDGKHRCFVRGNWETGLKLLAQSNHEALAAAAKQDLAGATAHDGQAAIARQWFDLGAADPALVGALARARHWYELAVKQAPAGERVKYEWQVEQISAMKLPPRLLQEPSREAVALAPASVLLSGQPAFEWTDLLAKITGQTPHSPGWLLGVGPPRVEHKATWSRLQAPVNPSGDYQTAVRVTRDYSGPGGYGPFVIGLPGRRSPFLAVFDFPLPTGGGACFLTVGSARRVDDNPTLTPNHSTPRLQLGRQHTIECKVRRSEVLVSFDGEPLLEYRGDQSRLVMPKEWSVPDSRSLFVGAHLAGFTLDSWTIAPLDDEGQPVIRRGR